MAKLTFKTDMCKGCGLCVAACPKKLLVLDTDVINAKGHTPVKITDARHCIACAFCATMSPGCINKVEK